MLRLIIRFLPWIILGVLGNRWFLPALVLALAVAAVTTVRQVFSRSLKILDTITFAFFVFVTLGLIGFGWMFLAIHMSLLVNVILTAVAWGSLLAGAPFTIQYAREQVAPELWHTPMFLRINEYITAVWGLDFFFSGLVSLYREVTLRMMIYSQCSLRWAHRASRFRHRFRVGAP